MCLIEKEIKEVKVPPVRLMRNEETSWLTVGPLKKMDRKKICELERIGQREESSR